MRSPSLKERSRLTRVPGAHAPAVVFRKVSGMYSASNEPLPEETTVVQMPFTETLCPGESFQRGGSEMRTETTRSATPVASTSPAASTIPANMAYASYPFFSNQVRMVATSAAMAAESAFSSGNLAASRSLCRSSIRTGFP